MGRHEDLRMEGEASLLIDVAPGVLYEMVSDVTRMGEWSPETFACRWVAGGGPSVGSQFEGDNRAWRGAKPWTMVATVAVADAPREFGFVTGKVEGPATEWRYRFEPEGQGTRVTESFAWKWMPSPAGFRARVGKEPIDVARRMVEARREALVASMRTTLDNLRRVAEESRP